MPTTKTAAELPVVADPAVGVLHSLGMIPIGSVRPDPANPRSAMEPASLAELASSVRHRGVLQPITVVATGATRATDPAWQVLYGHRRLAAAILAGQTHVPAVAREDIELGSAEGRIDQLLENFHRVDLTPLEEAAAFQALVDAGWSQRRIATAVGHKQPHISRRLKLLALPTDIRDDIDAGRLTIAAGLHLVDLVDVPPVHMGKARQQIVAGLAEPVDAVREQLRSIEWAERVEATTAALEDEGVTILRWPAGGIYGARWKVLATAAKELRQDLDDKAFAELPYDLRSLLTSEWLQTKVTKGSAAKKDTLAAVIAPSGHGLYVCTNPDAHRRGTGSTKPPPSAEEIERRARRERAAAARVAAVSFVEGRLFPLDAPPTQRTLPVVAPHEPTTEVGESLLRVLAMRSLAYLEVSFTNHRNDVALRAIFGLPDDAGWQVAGEWLAEVAPGLPIDQLLAIAVAYLTHTTRNDDWDTEGSDKATIAALRSWLAAHGHTDQLAAAS